MIDVNGATITVTEMATTSEPYPLAVEWEAAATTDEKLQVLAKALGIVA